MKLEDPIQLASCGPMDFGHKTRQGGGLMTKQPDAHLEGIEPLQLSAQHKTKSLEHEDQTGDRTSRLVINSTSKVAEQDQLQQRPRLRLKRHMAPTSRQQSRKHHFDEQQQVFPGSQNISHDATNLLLQQHIKNLNNHLAATNTATQALTLTTSSNRLDRAPTPADMSSTNTKTNISNTSLIDSSMSGLLGECFSRHQEANDHQQQQRQQQQTSQSIQLAGVEFISSQAAMAAQAVRQHHQRRQEILDQFASLHSLSAVATAIQQSHHLDLSQSSSFITQQQQQHLTMSHQFDLAQLQHHSKQLQFSLANLTLNNAQPIANVPSSLASSTSMQSVPMDLHQQQHPSVDSGVGLGTNGNQNVIAQSALMGMVRDSLVSRLTPLGLGNGGGGGGNVQTPSFVHYNAANQKTHIGFPGGLHQRTANSATVANSGVRIGRRRGSRKCRKIYGMAQRQLWCTQCKWKKACSRFFCANQSGQTGLHPASSSVASVSLCCSPMTQFRQTAAATKSGGIR